MGMCRDCPTGASGLWACGRAALLGVPVLRGRSGAGHPDARQVDGQRPSGVGSAHVACYCPSVRRRPTFLLDGIPALHYSILLFCTVRRVLQGTSVWSGVCMRTVRRQPGMLIHISIIAIRAVRKHAPHILYCTWTVQSTNYTIANSRRDGCSEKVPTCTVLPLIFCWYCRLPYSFTLP